MFGRKKKNAEEAAKKVMSSADSRAVEEMLAQAKAQQTLSLDELGGVAGGVIESGEAPTLMGWLGVVKKAGASKETCLTQAAAYLPQLQTMYPKITLQDVKDFIEQHYDEIKV